MNIKKKIAICSMLFALNCGYASQAHAIIVYDPNHHAATTAGWLGQYANFVMQVTQALATVRNLNMMLQTMAMNNDFIDALNQLKNAYGDALSIRDQIKGLPNELKGNWKNIFKKYTDFSPTYGGYTSKSPEEIMKIQEQNIEDLQEKLKVAQAQAAWEDGNLGKEQEQTKKDIARLQHRLNSAKTSQQQLQVLNNINTKMMEALNKQHQKMKTVGDVQMQEINARLQARMSSQETAKRILESLAGQPMSDKDKKKYNQTYQKAYEKYKSEERSKGV